MESTYIESLHRFLNLEMELAEHQAFEVELAQNAQLRQDLAFERHFLEALGNKPAQQTINAPVPEAPDLPDEASVKQNILIAREKLHKEGFFDAEKQSPGLHIVHISKTNIFMKRIFAIAAAAAALFTIVWFFNQPKSLDTKQVFAQHFNPRNDLAKSAKDALQSFGLAGVQNDKDSLHQALDRYEAGKYDESIALLKPLLEAHPQNDTTQYFLAMAHMNRERYAKAIELLVPLSILSSSAYKNDAAWNLGLCYLVSENGRQEAISVFKKLGDDLDFVNHREAKSMYDMLSSK